MIYVSYPWCSVCVYYMHVGVVFTFCALMRKWKSEFKRIFVHQHHQITPFILTGMIGTNWRTCYPSRWSRYGEVCQCAGLKGCIACLYVLLDDPYIALLNFLMKVLSEYPEAKMTNDEQNSSLGETYLDLVKRLDEGIPISCSLFNSFIFV